MSAPAAANNIAAAASNAPVSQATGATKSNKRREPSEKGRKKIEPPPKIKPQPGKFPEILSWEETRPETSQTSFSLDFQDVFSLCDEVTDYLGDDLLRYRPAQLAPESFLSNTSDSLKRMTALALATKLHETATQEQKVLLAPYSGALKQTDSLELPAQIVNVVDRIGNFETSQELWRFASLEKEVVNLLQLVAEPEFKTDTYRDTASSSWQIANLSQTLTENELLERLVNIKGLNTSMRPPRDAFTSDERQAEVAAILEPGPGIGNQDEFNARWILVKAMRNFAPPSDEIANAYHLVEGRPLDHTQLAPSQVKANISVKVAQFDSRYKQALHRTFETRSLGTLSESGSPAQLLRARDDLALTADGPTPSLTPTDYAYALVVDLHPIIVDRPDTSWFVTSGTARTTTRGEIHRLYLKAL